MASLEQKFTRYIRKHHSGSARVVWPPDSPPITPGDYGVVKDGLFAKGPFHRIGNLGDKDVEMEIHSGSPSTFALQLSSSVSFKALGAGSIPQIPGAEAAVEFAFGEEGAAVITGEDVTAPKLVNLESVRKRLIQLRKQGEWDVDYRLVIQVRHFPSAFIAISKSSSGKLVLGLKGTAIPSIEQLGKANVDVTVAFESGGFLKLTNARDVTPILYAARLERKGAMPGLIMESFGTAPESAYELIEDIDFAPSEEQEEVRTTRIHTPLRMGESFSSDSQFEYPDNEPSEVILARLGSAEALVASDENEADETITATDSPVTTSSAMAARGDFDRAEFDAFIASLSLRNFSAGEFLAMGGSNGNPNSSCYQRNTPPPQALWPNIIETARVLDEVRERLGVSITLSSVYRNESYNSCIGGASLSQHKRFNACDFTASGKSPREVTKALFKLRGEGFFRGGIGIYQSFTHVDTRGHNAEWAGSGATLQGLR